MKRCLYLGNKQKKATHWYTFSRFSLAVVAVAAHVSHPLLLFIANKPLLLLLKNVKLPALVEFFQEIPILRQVFDRGKTLPELALG